MQKVLRKRVLRDLKENLFRYIALAFLIIMGMYVIVSLIGAGYTIIDNGETHDEANKIEDGQFSVFVPLSDEEISRLEDVGTEVEGMFYEDYEVMDGKTIRVFANRENIDLVECDEGNLAEADDEIVVEKRFSQVNDISVGDIIQIAGNEFKVTGIGTSPDYNALFKEMSDTVVDSKVFGTVFVTENAYEKLHSTGESVKTETYLYAFRLKGKTTCDDVKDALGDIKVDTDRIDDEYFQEYWDRTGAAINDFKDGIKELKSGANELADGLGELTDNNRKLNNAAQELFDAYLEQASSSLSAYGLDAELTEDNYSDEMKKIADSQGGVLAMSIESALSDIDSIKAFKDGIKAYTDGAAEAKDGSDELADGVAELKKETDSFLKDYDTDLANITSFVTSDDNPRTGGAADDQQINVQAGYLRCAAHASVHICHIGIRCTWNREGEQRHRCTLCPGGQEKRSHDALSDTSGHSHNSCRHNRFPDRNKQCWNPCSDGRCICVLFHPCYGCEDPADSYSVWYRDAATGSDSCELLRYQKEALTDSSFTYKE